MSGMIVPLSPSLRPTGVMDAGLPFIVATFTLEPDGVTAGMAGEQTLFAGYDPVPLTALDTGTTVTTMPASTTTPVMQAVSSGTASSGVLSMLASGITGEVQSLAAYGALGLLGVLLLILGLYFLLSQ